MKTSKYFSHPCLSPVGLLLALALVPITMNAARNGRIFASPEAAVAALRQATTAMDTNALQSVLGAGSEELQNPDRVQAENDLDEFNSAFVATNHLVHISNTKVVLEVGDDLWPFPIPIVKQEGGWVFDTDAGKDELLVRRIGKNELSTLRVLRAYVDAQREYASRDRDGDRVLEYAQNLASSPGLMDGLYWPDDLGEISPLGPLVAYARGEGYSRKSTSNERQPFHGYLFKILTCQGKHAPGGKYDYVINGNMIAGFAMVAWPAEYEVSGVMTFIVNQEGRVYQRDLGAHTATTAEKLNVYDPDGKWKMSAD